MSPTQVSTSSPQLVDMFMESIKEDVNDDIKTCDWSPGQSEDFKLEQFGFVGVRLRAGS